MISNKIIYAHEKDINIYDKRYVVYDLESKQNKVNVYKYFFNKKKAFYDKKNK